MFFFWEKCFHYKFCLYRLCDNVQFAHTCAQVSGTRKLHSIPPLCTLYMTLFLIGCIGCHRNNPILVQNYHGFGSYNYEQVKNKFKCSFYHLFTSSFICCCCRLPLLVISVWFILIYWSFCLFRVIMFGFVAVFDSCVFSNLRFLSFIS